MSAKTVLLIEDNIAVLAAYTEILASMGLDIIPLVAPTYKKARTILSTEDIDLIILDLVLPDIVTTSILGELRREHPHLPILVVTGHPEKLSEEEAVRFGISQRFTKPFPIDILSKVILCSLHYAGSAV